jgi:hypothetical protein
MKPTVSGWVTVVNGSFLAVHPVQNCEVTPNAPAESSPQMTERRLMTTDR